MTNILNAELPSSSLSPKAAAAGWDVVCVGATWRGDLVVLLVLEPSARANPDTALQ